MGKLINTFLMKKNKIKQPLIQLNKFKTTVGELIRFGELLISQFGEDIFNFTSMQTLLFSTLKQIAPINKTIKLNEDSIEDGCKSVIKHFKLKLDNVSYLQVSGNTKTKIKRKQTYTEKFCTAIIHIDKLPSEMYQLLLGDVNKDLRKISELIQWYEEQPCIIKYIKKGEILRQHEERAILDFYNRCLVERVEILNYQLYNLKSRALEKSKVSPAWMGITKVLTESLNDRPYFFARPYTTSFFDYRQLNLSRHRVDEINISEANAMQKLYQTDKLKFYREYFKIIPVLQHFQDLKFYPSQLPLTKNRGLIYDELIKLFKGKRWISFYALALPQIEGLFSEMCLAVNPEIDLSQKSLTQKVDSVRKYHYLSSHYFDYYQYYIPIQRNKFAHTGYDDNFKLKSYDLLVDLTHLLKIFYDLDNPLVKIKKLHTRRNFENFISISDFVDYFQHLEQLKPSQKKIIKSDVDKFEKEFLNEHCSIEYTCKELIRELPRHISQFVEDVNVNYKMMYKELEFEKFTIPLVKTFLLDSKQLEILTNCFEFKFSEMENLRNYELFLMYYPKYLPSLKQEIKDELSKIKSTYSNLLKIISFVSDFINKQETSAT
ncbi:MAG: hypothetical protein JWN78_2475 [Bacteroidota bacterium]|nr:hypothetical protein [Bacteroidota bacterium]